MPKLHSFSRLNNIPLCVYMPHCVYPFIRSRTRGLFYLFAIMSNSVMNVGGGIAAQVSSETLIHSMPLLLLFSHKAMFADPMDCTPPGFSVHGISQARVLEWVAISFSGGYFSPRDGTQPPALAGGLLSTQPPGKHSTIPRAKISLLPQSLACSSRAQAHRSLTHGIILSKLLKFLLQSLHL